MRVDTSVRSVIASRCRCRKDVNVPRARRLPIVSPCPHQAPLLSCCCRVCRRPVVMFCQPPAPPDPRSTIITRRRREKSSMNREEGEEGGRHVARVVHARRASRVVRARRDHSNPNESSRCHARLQWWSCLQWTSLRSTDGQVGPRTLRIRKAGVPCRMCMRNECSADCEVPPERTRFTGNV